MIYILLNSTYIPFVFLSSIYNAIKNSTGQTEAPLLRVIILLIMKILFNFIFMVVLRMGIIGACVATLISYILRLWMYYDIFIKKKDSYQV